MTGNEPGGVGRVIVGHDGSAAAPRALGHAVRLALRHGAPLYVVAVHPTPRPSPRLPLPAVAPEELYADERVRVAAALVGVAGALPAQLDLRIAVVYGHPVRTLARLADRPGDVLVLPPGRRRPRRLGRGAAVDVAA